MRFMFFLPFLMLFLLALLAACDSGTDIPTPTQAVATTTPILASPTAPPPTINITRKDYEEALAKWESQGIEEYEIEYGEIPHASNDEGRSNYYVRGSAWANLPEVWPTSGVIATPVSVSIRDYPEPIHSLFAEVEQALRFVESNGQAPMVYRVEFDATLGYPGLYEENCLDEYTFTRCGTDSHTRKRIIRLEVLKRR